MSQPESGAVEVNELDTSIGNMLREKYNVEPEEAPAEEPLDAASVEGEEAEIKEEPEDSAESEEQESESESNEPDEESEDTFKTLSDFAEALEMPIDDFMASIKTTVKLNGEELEVNLSDLRNGYQMEADYRRKTSELAEQRKAFEQERSEQSQKLSQSLSQVDAMLTNAEQELIAEFNSVDWKELEELDREEYLVKESQFNRRYQHLQSQKQQAIEKASELQQLQQAEQQKALMGIVEKERSLMMDSIPEWNNEEVRKADEAAIETYLKARGFSPDEIYMQVDDQGQIQSPGIIDHRVINIIRDAMRYREQDTSKEIAQKRVKHLPKFVKPGNKQTSQEIKAKASDDKLKKFMKTGSREDLRKVLLDRM